MIFTVGAAAVQLTNNIVLTLMVLFKIINITPDVLCFRTIFVAGGGPQREVSDSRQDLYNHRRCGARIVRSLRFRDWDNHQMFASNQLL